MSAFAEADLFRAIASLVYPPACTICSASVGLREYLCVDCEAKLSRIVPPFCAKCSEPFDGAITNTFSCANCLHRVLYFDAAVSAYRRRGIARHVILNFKYGRQVHLCHLVARWLIAALDDSRLRERTFDAIIPIPLHPAKQRERGFNQAALLAQRLAPRLGIPVRPMLQRVRFTTTQTAFDRTERIQNLRHAFRLRGNGDVRNLRVLLIDDVLTTESTLSECARVLKENGAQSVHAVTAARA
jgi:ComF family protein